MAASLNKVMLIGNLGADPEVRSTPGGAQVANFRVACTENWKDQSGQRQERTEWVTIVAWRQQAEIAQKYLRKGSRVYVEGKLQTRTWDDKATGAKRYATEVLCDRFMMLDGRPSGGGEGGYEERGGYGGGARGGAQRGGSSMGAGDDFDYAPPPAAGGSAADDDLPF
ncbi:MAG TPA: single-stranded DNA-binding protein [Fibrobacteria bacterium]|nr:single-stranded DNA-binding protein [Fibrobacteria bacterium]HOX49972.1 single-stranded DNA-binding protein [Fibrobacteria bacterium]